MAAPLVPNLIFKEESFSFATEEDRKLHEFVNADVRDMENYAAPARQAGRDAIQGYMALTLAQFPDNRSKLFVPKLHAIVYSRMAMEAANMPKITYKHRKSASEPKMKFINAARENAETGDDNLRPHSLHLWFHQNFDKILLGVGFRYLSYLYQERMVTVKDDDGKPYEKRMVVYDDVWDEVPDFFNVGVSRDAQPGMFGASRCYMDKFFTVDAFKERFNSPYYQNIDLAAAQRDYYQGSGEYAWDFFENIVRVRYYWDLYKDLFYVQANGIPIRKDFILDYGPCHRPKKFLPITSIHNDTNYDLEVPDPLGMQNILQGGRQYQQIAKATTNKSFWSKSDAKLVQGLMGFSNSLWRAAHDHTKASSVHFLLAKSAGVLDQVSTADLYGIIPLKTDGDSFDVKSLTDGSQYLEKFQGMDEAIDNLMSFSLGNDWKRASAELTNEKATVAAIKQQVQRIRMAQNAKFNETGGIKRHYRILLNLIQQYYPEKTIQDLGSGEVPDGTEEKDIIRDRDGQPIAIRKEKEIPFDEEIVVFRDKGKLRVVGKNHPGAKGKQSGRLFPSYKDLIVTEEEPEIYVEPYSTFAELKAIDRAQELEFLQVITQFFGLQYEGKPLIGKEGAEYILKKIAEKWDKDPDSILGSINDAKEQTQLAKNVPPPFGVDGQNPAAPMPMAVPAGIPQITQVPTMQPGNQISQLAQQLTP